MEKQDRGFRLMPPEKQRKIASKGGKAAHQKGTAHEWTPEEAREAGRKGGKASAAKRQKRQCREIEEPSLRPLSRVEVIYYRPPQRKKK